MMQGPYSVEAVRERPGLTVMTAWLMSTSIPTHTLTSHSKSEWLEEKLKKAAYRANKKVASVHVKIRHSLIRYSLTSGRILSQYSTAVNTENIYLGKFGIGLVQCWYRPLVSTFRTVCTSVAEIWNFLKLLINRQLSHCPWWCIQGHADVRYLIFTTVDGRIIAPPPCERVDNLQLVQFL